MDMSDLGPLTAGLLFSPVSGVAAGLLGAVEDFRALSFRRAPPDH